MQSSDGWGLFSVVVIEMTPNRQPAKFKGCLYVYITRLLFYHPFFFLVYIERHCNITVVWPLYSQVGKAGSNFDWTLYRRRYERDTIILCAVF